MYAPIFPPMIGGPATQSAHLCRVLAELGEEPVVLTVGNHFTKERSPDGYWVYRYRWKFTGTILDKPIRWLIFLPVLMYVTWKEKPVIIHAHAMSALTFIVGVYSAITKTPSIVKFAGDWVWETLSASSVRSVTPELLKERYWVARVLDRIQVSALNKFDVQWAPSLSKKRDLEKLLGHVSTIEYIPNSLALPEPRPRKQKADQGRLIVSANRFVPHKRVSLIIELFERVAQPRDKLVLIGTGDEQEVNRVHERAKKSSMSSQIILTGGLSTAEVYTWLSQADVYISTSLEEGMPNVFIEAMYFGVPIVSTDVGGCRELVQSGKTGFLAPANDIDQLESQLRRILRDPLLRQKMSQEAENAAKAYDLHVVVQRFLAIYRKLLHI